MVKMLGLGNIHVAQSDDSPVGQGPVHIPEGDIQMSVLES